MARIVVSVVLGVALAACPVTHAEFTPYSAQYTNGAGKVVNYAITVYEGDIPALVAAGAQLIGTLNVGGNGFAGADDVRARAQYTAADYGGTHLLVASERARTTWAQVTPDTATTTFSGNTAYTTITPGADAPITRRSGAYLVVRVPPERWLDLPASIRPVPGRHFQGQYSVASVSRAATGPPGGQEPPQAQPMDTQLALGLWRSTFGATKLDADDAHGGIRAGAIHGVWEYTRQGAEVVGYFHGTLQGNVLRFQWQEPSTPPLAGQGFVVFDPSGQRFSGRWWTDARDRAGDWNGWRANEAAAPQLVPESPYPQ